MCIIKSLGYKSRLHQFCYEGFVTMLFNRNKALILHFTLNIGGTYFSSQQQNG